MPEKKKKSKLKKLSDKLHSILDVEGTYGPGDYVRTVTKRIKDSKKKDNKDKEEKRYGGAVGPHGIL